MAIAEPPPLTLLTYNVKGLPWPVTSGRPAALHAIAMQLLQMRREGRQPHLVALQEAFVPEAKAIGREAGYRYVVFGPPSELAAQPMTAADRAFMSEGSYLIGEQEGKHVGSGLAIFSDYPITAVRRIAYPVCAGYDCLANKGALAARIAVPGMSAPVTLVDTHLNSRNASGATPDRSLHAYQRQLDILGSFVASVAPAGSPLLMAGDFNVGQKVDRRSYFSSRVLDGIRGITAAQTSCLLSQHCALDNQAGLAESMRRGKDWLMVRSSPSLSIVPAGLSAPFGRAPDGSMLSDHVGISVTYRIARNTGTPGIPLRLASR
jgi:endonuclease/exonuclease/phosphatase family metal-dependent hydrolase